MDCTPEQAKDFVLEMQVYTTDIIEREFKPRVVGLTTRECIDVANQIVDYAFALMLKTHRGEKIKTETDDDIPF
jgi:hypothetical protein